jgi:transposase
MAQNIKRYSESFRRQVVNEYIAGSTIGSLQKKYGITGGQTIQYWIKKYAPKGLRSEVIRIQTAEEANRVKELERQVDELERALARTTLEKLKLESILEELELLYGEEAVKKNAARSLPASSKRSQKKQGSE